MYRIGEQDQLLLLPPSFDDFVGPHDPVRVFDAFIDQLKFEDLGITLNDDKVGNPEFHPKAMLKLLVYGYSYGIRSSRKLERATHHNISFMYLMGGLKPDHKTISRFRKNNLKALKKVLQQCARLCLKLDLIDGNTLFVDGTKIRANAGIKNTWSEQKCQDVLKKTDKQIEALLAECDAVDETEEGQGSFVQTKALQDKEDLKEKVRSILKDLNETSKQSINTIDPDCTKVKAGSGIHAGYNMQSVVDDKHGLIVHSDVVPESNDSNQFSNQISQANEVLGRTCSNACADAGYADTEDLKKVDDQKICVIVPSSNQSHPKETSPFDKKAFPYDSKNDCYRCPEGHTLVFRGIEPNKKMLDYGITSSSLCRQCRHFGACTTSPKGRRIKRLPDEALKEKLEQQYLEPSSQLIYKRRKEKVELPFGHFKRNLKFDAFLMRGREGASAEGALLSTCFNLVRIITILGVPTFLAKLKPA